MTPEVPAGAPAWPACRGPAVSAGIGRSRHLAWLRLIVAEKFLDPVPPLLHPVQRQAEAGDGIADLVIGTVAGQPDQHGPVLSLGAEAAPGEFGQQQAGAFLDFDDQDLATLREAGNRVGPQ